MKRLLLLLAFMTLMSLSSRSQEQRVPLFEFFGSSTCPACSIRNQIFKPFMDSIPSDQYVLIKYSASFPNVGDPYTTTSGMNHYWPYIIKFNNGQPKLPFLIIDGDSASVATLNDSVYQSKYQVPASYKLEGTYTLDQQTVIVKVKYKSLIAGDTPKVYVAVTESITENNVMTNGETMFYNVMKRMVPDENGTDISGTAVGEEDSVLLSVTFNGSYRLPNNGQPAHRINDTIEHSVENFDNLKVVAWVQGANNEVYQAANLVKVANSLSIDKSLKGIETVKIYPVPSNKDFVNVEMNIVNSGNITMMLTSVTGQIVYQTKGMAAVGKQVVPINIQNMTSGVYQLMIRDSNRNVVTQKLVITR